MSARADVVFNFNSLGAYYTQSDESTAIANYMSSVLGCSGCVSVSSGVAVAQQYNADGHVVGTGGVALTLGNSEGATSNTATPGAYGSDYYISNMASNTNGTSDSQLSQGIVITLSKGYSFTGTFSFDYQIFPDNTCTATWSCGGWNSSTGKYNNQPDLTFTTNGSTPANTTFWGVVPGTTDGAITKSADSNNETALQAIGTSGNFTLTNATVISFQDWPAAIGVDNLKLVTATPEPSGYAFLMGGLLVALMAGSKLRQRLAKSAS